MKYLYLILISLSLFTAKNVYCENKQIDTNNCIPSYYLKYFISPGSIFNQDNIKIVEDNKQNIENIISNRLKGVTEIDKFSRAFLDEFLIMKYLFDAGFLSGQTMLPCCGADALPAAFVKTIAINQVQTKSLIADLVKTQKNFRQKEFLTGLDLNNFRKNFEYRSNFEIGGNIFNLEVARQVISTEGLFDTLVLKDVFKYAQDEKGHKVNENEKLIKSWINTLKSDAKIKTIILFNTDSSYSHHFIDAGYKEVSLPSVLNETINKKVNPFGDNHFIPSELTSGYPQFFEFIRSMKVLQLPQNLIDQQTGKLNKTSA